MCVHMHVLHERAHTHTRVCVCKHMHTNACKHRLQTHSHRCLHMCVIAIQACNTGAHLHVLATACTCLQPFAHTFNACMFHSCTLAHATHACLQHMHMHSCRLAYLQHVHARACTVARSCNTCTLAHLQLMHVHAHTHATRACLHICTLLHRMHMHSAHTYVAAPLHAPTPPLRGAAGPPLAAVP